MNAASRTSSPRVRSLTLRLAVLVTATAMAATATAAQGKNLSYKMTDLGTLPGMTMSAAQYGNALNQRGQVTGWSYYNHYADDRPFIWGKGVMAEIPAPPGIVGGQGINDHGQVAGVWFGEQGGNWGSHGFFYAAGEFVPLPEPDGFIASWAQCLNNRGLIAGNATHPTLGSRPVLWEDGVPTILPMLDLGPDHVPTGAVAAINDAGAMAGNSGGTFVVDPINMIFSYDGHATLWEHGQAIDLGTLEGDGNSMAIGMNNAGAVVGQSGLLATTVSRGFIWTRQTGMVDLGMPPGWVSAMACGVNEREEVVGCVSFVANPQPMLPEYGSGPLPFPHNHAVLWKDGQCIDLQDFVPAGSPWTLILGSSINARAQILAWAIRVNDQPTPERYYTLHVFLLDPK